MSSKFYGIPSLSFSTSESVLGSENVDIRVELVHVAVGKGSGLSREVVGHQRSWRGQWSAQMSEMR